MAKEGEGGGLPPWVSPLDTPLKSIMHFCTKFIQMAHQHSSNCQGVRRAKIEPDEVAVYTVIRSMKVMQKKSQITQLNVHISDFWYVSEIFWP